MTAEYVYAAMMWATQKQNKKPPSEHTKWKKMHIVRASIRLNPNAQLRWFGERATKCNRYIDRQTTTLTIDIFIVVRPTFCGLNGVCCVVPNIIKRKKHKIFSFAHSSTQIWTANIQVHQESYSVFQWRERVASISQSLPRSEYIEFGGCHFFFSSLSLSPWVGKRNATQ